MRLEGTNEDIAKAIIENSGLAITSAADLDDAARKAVKALNLWIIILIHFSTYIYVLLDYEPL